LNTTTVHTRLQRKKTKKHPKKKKKLRATHAHSRFHIQLKEDGGDSTKKLNREKWSVTLVPPEAIRRKSSE